MSKINDFTDEKELSTLTEDVLYEEHFDATMELSHFVREKLHAEFHIQELDHKLISIEEELEKRENKPKLSLVAECQQKD